MLNIALLSRWHPHATGYGREFSAHPDCRVTVIWDEIPERGAAWAKELGCDFEPDYAKLLARSDVDAICCTAPTNLHRELFTQAARAGKHIFTEKVLAPTKADAEAVRDVLAETGVKFVISFPMRTNPRVLFAKKLLEEGLLAACLAPQRADFSALSGLPRTPEARWTGAKLACPVLQPEAFRLPARLCRLVSLTAGTWQEGRTELGWKRLIAAHGWETARLQADMQRTDAVRQIESRGDCVTLRQLAVTGADLPQLCGRDVGRMLQLLLAYVLEHPAENQKARLLTLAPQLWQRESKNNS